VGRRVSTLWWGEWGERWPFVTGCALAKEKADEERAEQGKKKAG